MSTQIISFINKKGGVGKTSSTGAVASICAQIGLKVLCVDLDPQCNITQLLTQQSENDYTIADLIVAEEKSLTEDIVRAYIKSTNYENIDIIAGNEDLDIYGDQMLLQYAEYDRHGTILLQEKAQTRLTKIFDLVQSSYDLILIDNTPYFNLITRNALSASTGVLIPVETDGYSYNGLTKLLKKIIEVKSEVNRSLDIIGIFVTRANNRTSVFKDLYDLFKEELGDKLLNTYIRQDNKVKESNTNFMPLYNYAPKSAACSDYAKLILEINILTKEQEKKLKDLYRDKKEK